MEITLLRDAGIANMAPVLCMDGVVRNLTEFTPLARTPLADQALPDALRGAKYRVGTDGVLTYLGRDPMTPEFLVECYEHYVSQNAYNQDWPHIGTECDPAAYVQAEVVRERLHRELQGATPAPVEIVAVVPRFLLYFTDGSLASQQQFLTVAPRADTVSPFRLDGIIKPAYTAEYSPMMRDMKVPLPPVLHGIKNITPLLFRGRAFCVEFTVANVDPAYQNCRVYVDWDGNFICSDWCQRASKSAFAKDETPVDLQTGQFTFATWVTTSAMVRAEAEVRVCKEAFDPYRGVRFSVGKLLENSPPPVPTLKVALENVAKRAAEFEQTPAGRLNAVRDAFVKTVDVMVETLPATLSDDAIAEQVAGQAAASLLLQTPMTRPEIQQLPEGFPVRTLQFKETETGSAIMLQVGGRNTPVDALGTQVPRVQALYADRDTLRELIRSARLRTPTPAAAAITEEAMTAATAAVAEYIATRRFTRKFQKTQHALACVTRQHGPRQVMIGDLEITFEPYGTDQVKITLLENITFYGWMDGEAYRQSPNPRDEGEGTPADLQSLGYLIYYYFVELGVAA